MTHFDDAAETNVQLSSQGAGFYLPDPPPRGSILPVRQCILALREETIWEMFLLLPMHAWSYMVWFLTAGHPNRILKTQAKLSWNVFFPNSAWVGATCEDSSATTQ